MVGINELELMGLCDSVGVLLLMNAKQAHSNEPVVRNREKNEAKRRKRNEMTPRRSSRCWFCCEVVAGASGNHCDNFAAAYKMNFS